MEKLKFKSAKDAVRHSARMITENVVGPKSDFDNPRTNTGAPSVKVSDEKHYKYYPWGKKNRRPFEVIELKRSNADMINLLKTRVDFLFGAGLSLFSETVDNQDLILTPYWNSSLKDWFLEKDLNGLADSYYTNFVELANAFVNVDHGVDGDLTLRGFDASMFRVAIPEDLGKITHIIQSPKWDTDGQKYAKAYRTFDYASYKKDGTKNLPTDTYIHSKPVQTGQFWYGVADWTALEPVIKLANRIPGFHDQALDTEGNIGTIFHVARKYFTDMVGRYINEATDEPYTEDELIEAWDSTADEFLFGEGKRKILRDVCEFDAVKGQLVKLMEVEPIKKGVSGEEYLKLAAYAKGSMSDGSQVLGGLSGVSDGKLNSGGGTEIRISAQYQQFYRTPREREQFLRMLNLVYVPILRKNGMIPEGVFFHHKNILLETLERSPKGSSEVAGNSKE